MKHKKHALRVSYINERRYPEGCRLVLCCSVFVRSCQKSVRTPGGSICRYRKFENRNWHLKIQVLYLLRIWKDDDEESSFPWKVKESRGRWKPAWVNGKWKSLPSCSSNRQSCVSRNWRISPVMGTYMRSCKLQVCCNKVVRNDRRASLLQDGAFFTLQEIAFL